METSAVPSESPDDRSPAESQPKTAAQDGALWRRVLALVLIVLFGILAPLGLIASWARTTVLDTDRFVSIVAPLASEPAVQDAVTAEVTRIVMERVNELRIPSRAGTRIEDAVAEAVQRAVSSETFATIWEETIRISHGQLVAALTGEETANVQVSDGKVIVDVSGVLVEVETYLAELGYTVDLASRLSAAPAQVTIFESKDVDSIQSAVQLLDRAGFLLPLAALVALVAAIVVATNRWRTVRRAGIALIIGMVLVAGMLIGGRTFYLRAIDESPSRDVAEDVFDAVTRYLWIETIVLLIIGVVAVAVAFIVERRAGRERTASAVPS
jgi:hypothetical protein